MPMRATRSRWGCLGAALLLLSACSGSQPDVVLQSVSVADVNVFLQEMLDEAPPLTYSDLVERLGPPSRVKAEPASPPDTLRTLIYHGLELTLFEEAAPPISRPTRFAPRRGRGATKAATTRR